MSVRAKLLAIVIFVAFVPLTVSAVSTLTVHQAAFDKKLAELHTKVAEQSAKQADDYLHGVRTSLARLVGRTVDWRRLNEAERTGALTLVYSQFDDIAVVSLLDAKGQGLGPSVYAADKASARKHPVADMNVLGAFSENIPFADAMEKGAGVGEPFLPEGSRDAYVALAYSVTGAQPAEKWVAAVALSLRNLCAEALAAATEDVDVRVLDGSRRMVCVSEPAMLLQKAQGGMAQALDEGGFSTYRGQGGEEWVAASGKLENGWAVVTREPSDTAFAASHRMRLQAILWIVVGLVVAVGAGIFLSFSISRPIDRLMKGVAELASGNLSHRIELRDKDEFGRLGRAFDKMGEEISARDEKIKRHNAELQTRVEERTRSLQKTQKQLLQSQKTAAMATLGSGVANEINNPLTGVLGMTQVLLDRVKADPKRAKEASLLAKVESEAQRIRTIVKRLLDLSQGRAESEYTSISVNDLLESALRLLDRDIEAKSVHIVRELAPDLPKIRGSFAQLQQAVLQILDNAVKASPKNGRVIVTTWTFKDRLVRISIEDAGYGIAPDHVGRIFEPFFATKEHWEGEGLGLAIAHRIVQEHGGKISPESTPGRGTTMVVALPIEGHATTVAHDGARERAEVSNG